MFFLYIYIYYDIDRFHLWHFLYKYLDNSYKSRSELNYVNIFTNINNISIFFLYIDQHFCEIFVETIEISTTEVVSVFTDMDFIINLDVSSLARKTLRTI